MGCRGLFALAFWIPVVAHGYGKPQFTLPSQLPLQIVYRLVKPPAGFDQERAPIEQAESTIFGASLLIRSERSEAPDYSTLAKMRVQPIVEYEISDGVEQVELPWMNAAPFLNYLNRIPTDDQIVTVEMEDGTWAKATPKGLHLDWWTKRLTVPFKLLELERTYNGQAELAAAYLEIPIEQLGDRVLTRRPHYAADVARGQTYFLNRRIDQPLPITVLGFEFAVRDRQGDLLTPPVPGFRNGSHSAIAFLPGDIEGKASPYVRIYRIPVGLLRTAASAGERKRLNENGPDLKTSTEWLRLFEIDAVPVSGSLAERIETVRKFVDSKYPIASTFDLRPPQECRALIVAD